MFCIFSSSNKQTTFMITSFLCPLSTVRAGNSQNLNLSSVWGVGEDVRSSKNQLYDIQCIEVTYHSPRSPSFSLFSPFYGLDFGTVFQVFSM